MSVKVWSLCWRVPVGGNAKLVLLRLADFANDAGGSIYPAISTVAEDCGISDRTVQYCIKDLEKQGIIVRNKAVGRGYTSSYRIDMNRLNEMARPPKEYEQTRDTGSIKGADFAPLTDGATTGKGADFDGKGADFDGKGASPAPNPSESVKNPPPAYSSPAKTNGTGGGSDIDFVIKEHYRMVAEIWGEEAMREARSGASTNASAAGYWLQLAGGSVKVVCDAIREAFQLRYANSPGDVPGSLAASKSSVPRLITAGPKTYTLTSASKPSAGQAKIGVKAIWLAVFEEALANGHSYEANTMLNLAGNESPGEVEEANAYAESVREHVSRKKERAAA